MDLVVSICCYLFVVIVALFLSTYRIRIKIGTTSSYRRDLNACKQRDDRLSFVAIVMISAAFVLYNVIVTKMNSATTHDRQIYTLVFYGYRTSPSAGLSYVISIVKRFSSNVEVLYYVTTLLCMTITLIAYRVDNEASPRSLLFLLTTQYIFFSLEGLKQAYANAFAVLCIALALRNDGKKDTVMSIVSIILAITFHHTGYFLIPIYIALRLKKDKKTTLASFVLLALMIAFFEPFLMRVASILSPYASTLSAKIYQYFGDSASDDLQTEGVLTFVKGFPFYVITIVGWIKRDKLVKSVENYDNFLFISGILSFTYMATLYNAWIYRLSYFFYLPEGIFYAVLMRNIENHRNKVLFMCSTIVVTSLLTLRFVMLMYFNYGGF